ncbi:MAG: DMT family transporter [Proteobacteria bacterium]|nr:DMT family transporter [Pseudomonadota bacterium]MBI3495989.1 DMT family transporter [Pseudomonadota bacterium]
MSPLFGRLPPVVRGAFWMIVAGVCYSLMSALIRQGSAALPAFEMMLARNMIAFAVLSPMLFRHGLAVTKATRPWLAGSLGVLQVVSNIAWFIAMASVPLGDATALGFITPLIVPGLAVLFLGEAVPLRRWLATLVGFGGAIIIIRPGFQTITPGILLVLGSSFSYAAFVLVSRSLSADHHPSTIVFYTLAVSQPLALLLALPVWQAPSWEGWLMLFAIGFCASGGQISATYAYAAAEASLVMPFDFLKLPIAAAIAFAMFQELPDVWTWIGGVIVFAAGIYVARRESV